MSGGTTPVGEPLKLDRAAIVAMAHGDQSVLEHTVQPMDVVIDTMTDARMREAHGDS